MEETVSKNLIGEVLKQELAKKDPWIFVTEYCKTDYNKNIDGDFYESACELVPPHKYLKELISYIHGSRKIAIPKSRRMLVTWVVLCYCLWYALYHENSSIYLQKIKEDDAGFADPNESLCSRIMKVYDRLPTGLKEKVQPSITKKPPVIHFVESKSAITGVAEGPDQLRGKDATIIVIDEMAKLDKNKETFETIMPIVNTGAKLICISTPNGNEYFYRICKGLENEEAK